MKKMALLTIHDTLNFGSLLQTYSTYSAINYLGYDVTLLDYKNSEISKRESTYKFRDVKSIKDLYKAIFHHSFLKRKHDEFWKFISTNMHISKKYNKDNVIKANDEYDAFIVGSDIVWGMEITGNDLNYMLKFAKEEKKKIAFSSSVGTRWPKEMDDEIGSLLERFDNISVREELAINWINEVAQVLSVCQTCDPTMLWEKEFWEKYNKKELAPRDKYVLVYLKTDDNRTVTDAIKYAKKHKMLVYNINYNHNIFGVKNIRPSTVEEWISLFANAHTIFTASYHGILFSLYFNKPFFWYSRANSARTTSLSNELSIQNREGNEENCEKDLPMNYTSINKIIERKRNDSWKILMYFLEIEK